MDISEAIFGENISVHVICKLTVIKARWRTHDFSLRVNGNEFVLAGLDLEPSTSHSRKLHRLFVTVDNSFQSYRQMTACQAFLQHPKNAQILKRTNLPFCFLTNFIFILKLLFRKVGFASNLSKTFSRNRSFVIRTNLDSLELKK